MTGKAKFSKQRPNPSLDNTEPLQKAVVALDDVTLCLSKAGLANFSFLSFISRPCGIDI